MSDSDRDEMARKLLDPWDMSPAGMGYPGGNAGMAYSARDLRPLLDSGAARVTQGGGKQSADPEDYSLVTHYNDTRGADAYTRDWANKPQSYPAATRDFAAQPQGMLYPGKYKQLLWSAQKRGMFE